MDHPDSKRDSHLGMSPGELDDKWYARYWNPSMNPLPEHVRDALLLGPQPAELAARVEDIPAMLEPGYSEFETGFAMLPDGSMHVAVLTHMPGVAPQMWDWWFWWHSAESQRYKLWHPRAHMYAQWASPRPATEAATDRDKYVGRTSFVDEYLGGIKSELAIRFVSPSELGIDEAQLDASGETAICARGGLSRVPIDAGYLVHHVRPVADGSEMRSRFWLGGKHVAARISTSAADPVLRRVGKVIKRTQQQAYDLTVHCSQEMSHLASFLPAIYAAYHDDHKETC